MSGEYYGAEKPIPNFYNTDYEAVSPHSKKDKYETPGQDNRLNDIEEQLEMAEDRCNTLKGQLDYMKHLYGTKKKTRKVSTIHPNVVKNQDGDSFNVSTSSVSVGSSEQKTNNLPKRQNSNAIGTDNTGAAVRTINNILTGITDSVNRLSELHVQISESPKNRMADGCILSPIQGSATEIMSNLVSRQMGKESENAYENDKNQLHILTKPKGTRKRTREYKGPVKKQTSSQLLKKTVKVDRRSNSAIYPQHGTVVSRKLVHGVRGKGTKTQATDNDPALVEIFHNKQIKSSDSDDCQRSKQPHEDGDHQDIDENYKDTGVPVLDLPLSTCQEINISRSHTRRLCQNVLAHDFYYSEGMAKGDRYQKSYELPTIASRMKQVAKNYLSTFSFKTMVCKLVGAKASDGKIPVSRKTIPFCAAISTSPSHNIGINIQQVMNILKNRQPVNGISPTLAHNIGLAAERLNSRPLSTLVSSINSNTCCVKPQQCPLSKCKLNYQYLQDLAKNIPEETAEEVEQEGEQEVKTIIITGPSGDMEVKSTNLPQWAVDKSDHNICTCVPNPGLDINSVHSKVRKFGNIIPSQSTTCQKSRTSSNKWNLKTEKRPQSCQPIRNGINENPFEGKEKSLKLVLTHLHDEFEALNKRYEELSHKPAEEYNASISKEIELLEAELTKKEEEITMVMSLCKEVMALKQQIKSLKQNSSRCSVPQEKKEITTSSTSNDFSNPQAAFHLTKLLQQIQSYQLKYKNSVGV